MSLDQMFSMLRNWGEGHTAFGQTAQTQRAAPKRKGPVEGRKADAARRRARPASVVLESQIRPQVAREQEDRSVPLDRPPLGGDAANADQPSATKE